LEIPGRHGIRDKLLHEFEHGSDLEELMGLPVWSPRQLRHTRATLIRQAYGLEAAKAVLGHADTKITEIYAERDLELAVRIMREIG
jgi:integrase